MALNHAHESILVGIATAQDRVRLVRRRVSREKIARAVVEIGSCSSEDVGVEAELTQGDGGRRGLGFAFEYREPHATPSRATD